MSQSVLTTKIPLEAYTPRAGDVATIARLITHPDTVFWVGTEDNHVSFPPGTGMTLFKRCNDSKRMAIYKIVDPIFKARQDEAKTKLWATIAAKEKEIQDANEEMERIAKEAESLEQSDG